MHQAARNFLLAPAWGFAARFSAPLLAGVLLLGVACSSDSNESAATLSNPTETGSQLVTEFIVLLQQKDTAKLQGFLSDAFILQRANGGFYVKADYLQNLPEIGEFQISEVTAVQAGDALVVRWSLEVNEVIEGSPWASEPAPRLSTFIYQDGRWRMSSHANFNVPATPPASTSN